MNVGTLNVVSNQVRKLDLSFRYFNKILDNRN